MTTLTGLDVLVREDFLRLNGKTIGLVCNQASVSNDYRHVLDILKAKHQKGDLHLKSVFGPQHGLFGHTQDNMIEWEADDVRRQPFSTNSLYGQHREPTPAMLKDLELLVVDLQDVGARYYTFIWTLALCLKACGKQGVPVMVLDRPNPISGLQIEGTVQDPNYASFVGLYPLPMRHGLTIGEIATHLQSTYFRSTELHVVRMEGWDRSLYLDETDAPWAVPSPNMPTVDTAVVYPGGCLIEGTNLSEGRGTTRPFEIIGAPYLDGWKLADTLNSRHLPGITFRPLQFEPTFNKHAKTLCEGVFLHVTDRKIFEPALTFVALLQDVSNLVPGQFAWNPPPYEYEYLKLPIDILNGNTWLREAIDNQTRLNNIRDRFREECAAFAEARSLCLLYP